MDQTTGDPNDIQAIIQAAMNGAPGSDGTATPAAAPGTPTTPASPDGSTPGGSLFGRDRYVEVKADDGTIWSVDLSTATATQIKGLPGKALSNTPQRLVKTDTGYAFVDPVTKAATPVTGLPTPAAKNVPAADQTMPGTGTPEVPSQGGSTGDLSTAYGDMYFPPTTEGTPATPDLTVGQYDARTRARAQANTEANDKAARDLEAKRVAIEQTNQELKQGQDAITNAYNNKQLNLEQSKAAADLLYKQADIELRARIADQTYGRDVAAEEMKRLPAGTLASFGPTAQAALQGRFVAPNIPPDNRDPTQIALKAIADLKAGMGPTPAATSLAGSSYSGLNFTPGATGGTGLTLPPAGGTGGTQTNLTQPVTPPYFPRPGATTGPF